MNNILLICTLFEKSQNEQYHIHKNIGKGPWYFSTNLFGDILVDELCIQITYKSSAGGDAHATTSSILNMLASFPWEAKLVITLAAFGLSYGEFWLLAQIYSSNQLAKSVAILKQVPIILEHSASLKPRFDSLNNLIKAMMDVTKSIIELKGLPSMYISKDIAPLSTALAHIPAAVYWTIRAVIACATQISNLSSMGPEYVFHISHNYTNTFPSFSWFYVKLYGIILASESVLSLFMISLQHLEWFQACPHGRRDRDMGAIHFGS